MSVERETFQTLLADGQLAGFPTDDYWLDSGRPELYLQANLDLVRGSRLGLDQLAVHPAASVGGAERRRLGRR